MNGTVSVKVSYNKFYFHLESHGDKFLITGLVAVAFVYLKLC